MSNSASTATPGQTANPAIGVHISQKLRGDLAKAGFTDIKIMPESFLVRAKDSRGNPVMLVMNADSVAALMEGTQGTNAASNAKLNNQDSASVTQRPASTSTQPGQSDETKP
jgi:hypothetical protein